MKKAFFMILLTGTLGYSQNSTGTVSLSTGMSVKIDTDPTTVTLTLTGPANSDVWFGIGFGGRTMATATDMFIYSSATERDYTSTGRTRPSIDTGGVNAQNWTIVSDTPGTARTVVATRSLISSGDYTFLNNNSSIDVVFAYGSSLNLGIHASRNSTTLTRTALGVEDFSLNAATVGPNPAKGSFTINSKTGINKVDIYSQTGAFVKTINVNPSSNTEVSVNGLSQGIYLMKLENDNDKSWKKVIVE
jgi:hypothetical protein